MDEGRGNVTSEEVSVAKNRVHDKDKKDIIAAFKKIVASNKKGGKNMFRILRCQIKEVNDGYMLKMEVEKFSGGANLGKRWIKGYFTESMKDTIIKSIETVAKKTLTDNRDGTSYDIPEIIEKVVEEAPVDLDLNTLWDPEDKG